MLEVVMLTMGAVSWLLELNFDEVSVIALEVEIRISEAMYQGWKGRKPDHCFHKFGRDCYSIIFTLHEGD